MWVISLVVLVAEKDLGSSLLFFGMFLDHRLRGHRAPGLRDRGCRAVRRRGDGGVPAPSATSRRASQSGSTRSPMQPARATSSCSRCSRSAPDVCSAWASATASPGASRSWRPTSSSRPSARSSGSSAERRSSSPTWSSACAVSSTAARARSDMAAFTAAGLVGVFALQTFVIIGGVIAADPADRHHAAVRELRRLVDPGQLHPARAAAARGRRRYRSARPRWSAPAMRGLLGRFALSQTPLAHRSGDRAAHDRARREPHVDPGRPGRRAGRQPCQHPRRWPQEQRSPRGAIVTS